MASGEGTAFGKYFLLKKLAAGGMGEIFLAKLKGPVGFEKLLVIKRMLAHHVENEEFVDMFFAEARVAAQLNHSNIAQIYEMGEIDDAYFIAMEYVFGKSLRELFDRRRTMDESIDPAHAIDIISKLCSGLSYAHSAKDMAGMPLGIVHRDVNPQNVLISYSGEVKIIDFGIAKSKIATNKTETGTIKGKFVYMSPEQSAAEKVDRRSDIFSAGICLYETLTLHNPFAKANVVLSLDAIQRTEVPPLPEELAAFNGVIDLALAKKASARYRDCAEMREGLQQLLESGAVKKPPMLLAQMMQESFAEQIEEEKRLLATDIDDSPELAKVHKAREEEHRSNPQFKRRRSTGGRNTPHVSAPPPAPPHSRLPFFAILTAIVMLTGIASTAVTRIAKRSMAAESPAAPISAAPPARAPEPPPPAPAAAPPTAPPAASAVAAVTSDLEHGPDEELVEEIEEENGKQVRRLRRRQKGSGGGKALSQAAPTPREDKRGDPSEPPPAPEPPSGPNFGSLQLSTSPPVRLLRNGAPCFQSLPKMKSDEGTLTFGAGSDPKRDPFEVTVRYKIANNGISYSVDANPWAIVRKGGIGIGKTPLSAVEGESNTVLELLNPKDGLRLRITLKYSPP